MRRAPREDRLLAAALAAALAVQPGCEAVGGLGADLVSAGARTFVPNPIAGPAWGLGLGLGFLAGLPLVLLGAPLALVFADEGDGAAAALAPALALGAGVGALLALPVWPFGLPFVPDPPPAPAQEPPVQAPPAPSR